jgi:tetratricopeptide (TPR) repeat protein
MASSSSQLRPPAAPPENFFLTDSRARTLLLCCLLAVAVLAVYYPVHTHPYSRLDDYPYLVDNPRVQEGLNWHTLYWSVRAMNMAQWIPLTWLVYALDYQFFGLDPAGHHMVDVALHALSAILLFWVLKRATGFTGRSFMVAALFALHPTNVEAVVWIAELKSVLCMVFFLLTLAAYRWYALHPNQNRYTLLLVLFGLGLAAKSQIITLPFVLLLWDYWPLQRMFPNAPSASPPRVSGPYPPRSLSQLILEKVPLLFLCLVDAALTVYTQKGVRLRYLPPLTWRLKNAIFSYVLYLRNLFWPANLAPELPQLGRFLSAWQVLAALVLLLAITALVISARRYRYLPVGWLWFLGMLVPMLGILQAGQQGMADRFTYQAYIGLFIMICWGISDWAQRRHLSLAWLAAAGAVVLATLVPVTVRQIGYWQDELTLWSHAAQASKYHWLAQLNVGVILQKQGDDNAALAYFYRASEINPQDSGSNIQIAQILQKRGDHRGAIDRYQHALQDVNLSPDDGVKVWLNMAVAYRDLGDDFNARRCVDEANDFSRQTQ